MIIDLSSILAARLGAGQWPPYIVYFYSRKAPTIRVCQGENSDQPLFQASGAVRL